MDVKVHSYVAKNIQDNFRKLQTKRKEIEPISQSSVVFKTPTGEKISKVWI